MSEKYNKDFYPEIFIGLVASIGVDLNATQDALICKFKKYGYDAKSIKLSQFIENIFKEDNENKKDTFERYINLIGNGNELRNRCKRNSILSMLSILNIINDRKERKVNNDSNNEKIVYIFNQLKTPEELKLLKFIYGENFFSVAVMADNSVKNFSLQNRMAGEVRIFRPESIKARVEELYYEDNKRNLNDNSEYCQNIDGTLNKADYYIEYNGNEVDLTNQIKIFCEKIFQRPYKAPNANEYCMSVAFNAALRSVDMGQQIGCCIASDEGEIVATGFNEVPCEKSGGNYWENKTNDKRDYACGDHSIHSIRKEYEDSLIDDIKTVMVNNNIDSKSYNLNNEIESAVRKRFRNIIEFGRSVHAEMAALTEAARLGKSVQGKILYTTTYPCHLCAINIIASGIKKVFYLKNYPKSRAERMFSDTIQSYDYETGFFQPYLGVSPRSYSRIYSNYYDDSLRDKEGKPLKWNPIKEKGNINMLHYLNYYIDEKIVGYFLYEVIKNNSLFNDVCLPESTKKIVEIAKECKDNLEVVCTELGKDKNIELRRIFETHDKIFK